MSSPKIEIHVKVIHPGTWAFRRMSKQTRARLKAYTMMREKERREYIINSAMQKLQQRHAAAE